LSAVYRTLDRVKKIHKHISEEFKK
jgi:hypothetical protein